MRLLGWGCAPIKQDGLKVVYPADLWL